MKRRLIIAAAVALLAAPMSAEAGGCVLAHDPAGDARESLPPATGPQHDIRRLAVDVTPTVLVLRTTVEDVSTTPPPVGTGDAWTVWFTTGSGEVQVFVHRTYRRDFAAAGIDGGRWFDVFFRIDEATATITAEVPYARLGLSRGDKITQVRAYAGPFTGVDLGVGEDNGLLGKAALVDEAPSTRSIVVGVGCR